MSFGMYGNAQVIAKEDLNRRGQPLGLRGMGARLAVLTRSNGEPILILEARSMRATG